MNIGVLELGVMFIGLALMAAFVTGVVVVASMAYAGLRSRMSRKAV